MKQTIIQETKTVLFPNMHEKLTTPRFFNLITAHLDACKDVCDFFGITTTLQPFVKDGTIHGFTVKSFRNPGSDPNSMEFEYDPFWDDDETEIPIDQARTTTEFLAGLWKLIAQGNDMVRGVSTYLHMHMT